MSLDSNSLAALIGSRICHDLISPIGAVNNGLELLELSGQAKSPELALVAQSVADANARIRFFRLAFGVASPDQMTGAEEVNTILDGLYADTRITTSGLPEGSYPRAEVRAVLLALLCVEQAIPYGGALDIAKTDAGWTITATSDRLSPDPEMWAYLQGSRTDVRPAPAAVQFALLPQILDELNMNFAAYHLSEKAEIIITPA